MWLSSFSNENALYYTFILWVALVSPDSINEH
jgi:hypothetical protein